MTNSSCYILGQVALLYMPCTTQDAWPVYTTSECARIVASHGGVFFSTCRDSQVPGISALQYFAVATDHTFSSFLWPACMISKIFLIQSDRSSSALELHTMNTYRGEVRECSFLRVILEMNVCSIDF